MNPQIAPPDWRDQLELARQLAANRLLRPNYIGNVVGVGIGKKYVNDTATPTDCIRVYVVGKTDITNLSPAAVVPASFLDVPTDIIAVGHFGRKGYRSPPEKGASIQPGAPIRVNTVAPNINAGFIGTLGAKVKDTNDYFALSCNHVLAVNGRVPEDADIESAALIESSKKFAKPTTKFIPLMRHRNNTVDCALASLTKHEVVKPNFPATITLSSPDPIPPHLGMKVKKFGAVTDVTSGTIVDKDAELYIDYSFGTFRFGNQVIIDGGTGSDFARSGDSGSLVIDSDSGQATAMIFAASGRYAVACPIDRVLNQLGVTLVVSA